jgi:DNA-binding NarL/FixJ family response regulator
VNTKLLVCHRDGLVADAIRTFLEAKGFEVTITDSLEAALDVASENGTCLVDLRLPGALDHLRQLASMPDSPRVLALVDSDQQVRAATRSGARGWVTTADGLDRLVYVLENEHARGAKSRPARLNSRPPENGDDHGLSGLTAREREVFVGLVQGESTKALAARLNVSPATARTHVQNVLAKLGVHSRLQAVALVEDSVVRLLTRDDEEHAADSA